jgi:hypothetical protein
MDISNIFVEIQYFVIIFEEIATPDIPEKLKQNEENIYIIRFIYCVMVQHWYCQCANGCYRQWRYCNCAYE